MALSALNSRMRKELAMGLHGKMLPQEQFKENIEKVYQLCEAWMNGTISNTQFFDDQWGLLTHCTWDEPDSWPVECDQGATKTSAKRASMLESEFGRTGNFTHCISLAIPQIEDAGYGESASALIRAFYFAQNWSPEISKFNEGKPPRFELESEPD